MADLEFIFTGNQAYEMHVKVVVYDPGRMG